MLCWLSFFLYPVSFYYSAKGSKICAVVMIYLGEKGKEERKKERNPTANYANYAN